MPWNKVGMYTMRFHLFKGDVENVATQIEVKNELEVKTIWTGSAALNWNAMQDLAWGGYDWSTVKPGTVLTAYFELDSSGRCGLQTEAGVLSRQVLKLPEEREISL